MKVCTIALGVLVACAAALATETSPLLTALQPRRHPEVKQLVFVEPPHGNDRQKRSLLLGAGALGLGAGVLGAGLLGAGLVGAKAGFVGGALAAGALGSGRSYGGWGNGGYGGYGGGYGGYYSHEYGGYGGYGGYGHRSYYPSSYWW